MWQCSLHFDVTVKKLNPPSSLSVANALLSLYYLRCNHIHLRCNHIHPTHFFLAMQVLYDQALTHGYIESRSIVSVLTGAAGSGKTHVKHLLFKKKPPVIRISTALIESPVRAVSLTRVNTDEDDWHEIDDDEQCRMIAAALNTVEVLTETASEATSQEMVLETQQRSDVPGEQQSAEQATTANQTNPLSTSVVQNTITQSTQHPSLPQKALTSQDDQEPDDSGVGEELVRLMLTSSGSKKLLQADRIYLFDTGGQTIFHELLRLFLRRESITIFVTKLNEKLDQHPMIEYYSKEGNPLNQPHPSPLTHEDILKHSFRAVQSQACAEDESQETAPRLLVVGTHLDEELQCTESRETKNEKLISLLTPAFQRMLVYYGEEIKELIFPVNAKNPGRQDQEVARELRKAILSAMSSLKSHKTPLAWHILEIALRKLAASLSRSILSRQECLRVARKLHLSEEQLDAAFHHFMRLNLILNYQSHAVFTDPQIIFDKVTDLVQYSYRLQCKPDRRAATSGELLEFRDEGVITLKLLKEFPKHYVSDLFSPSDLICILEHQLIIAHISEGKYFMPSLLLDLPGEQVERHRVEPSSPAAPFVIYFPGGLAPCGIFCALVASLLSPLNPLHWQLLHSPTNPVRPACVARNCIEFKLPDGYAVALIDTYTHFEVHFFAPDRVCSHVCPQIRTTIFQNLHFATKALQYSNLTPTPAFLCELAEEHVEEEFTPDPLTRPTEKAAPPPHVANFSTSNGNWWTCSLNPRKAYGKLEERHMIWLRAASKCMFLLQMHNIVLSEHFFILQPPVPSLSQQLQIVPQAVLGRWTQPTTIQVSRCACIQFRKSVPTRC